VSAPSWFRGPLRGGALGIAVALVVLFPGWTTGSTRLIGDEGVDVWSHAFGIRWFFDALADGRLPWAVDGLAWPRGGILWYIDPVGALVALPAQLLAGPIVAHNWILFVQVVIATWAGWAFGRALGGRGWLAGVALGTAPTFLGEIHNGTIEACWFGLVPLAAWAAIRWRWWSGALVGLAALATAYHGISAAILVGTILLLAPHSDDKRPPWSTRFKRLGLTAVLTLAIALPAFLALKYAMADPLSLTKKSMFLLNYPTFRINAVDPIALVHMGDFWTVEAEGVGVIPFRRTPYLGLLLIALSLVSLWRRRRRWLWLVPVGVTVVLALGPFLWHDGDFYRTADGQLLALPFKWALTTLGVAMDHPLRFIGCAITVLAGLADRGLRDLEKAVPAPSACIVVGGMILVGAEHLTLAPNVWPIHTSDGAVPKVYSTLTDTGAVLDLPAARGESLATNRYLYWHAHHQHPIPYANKIGPNLPNTNPLLRQWTDISRTRPRSPDDPNQIDPRADVNRSLQDLADTGFRWVVLHPDLILHPSQLRSHREALENVLGPPTEIDGDLLWEIPTAP